MATACRERKYWAALFRRVDNAGELLASTETVLNIQRIWKEAIAHLMCRFRDPARWLLNDTFAWCL